jgi:uncharacterized phiE125 gp8 family phage protein
MRILRTVAPTSPVVDLDVMKAHLKVDHDDDDDVISAMVLAATGALEGPRNEYRRVLMPQTWQITLDAFPTAAIEIPVLPLIEVVSVTYDDADGAPQVVDAGDYYVDAVDPDHGWIVPAGSFEWPATLDGINAVRISVRAGYERTDSTTSPPSLVSDVPEEIIAAVKLLAAHYYRNREAVIVGTVSELPLGVQHLLRQFKWWVLA